jgi:hypothetical protein
MYNKMDYAGMVSWKSYRPEEALLVVPRPRVVERTSSTSSSSSR